MDENRAIFTVAKGPHPGGDGAGPIIADAARVAGIGQEMGNGVGDGNCFCIIVGIVFGKLRGEGFQDGISLVEKRNHPRDRNRVIERALKRAGPGGDNGEAQDAEAASSCVIPRQGVGRR